ncbi:EAL domain-containing protein [Comamonas sp. Y33R10-2]|uniref:bifunctional diguanylate cyclase/phosphodiesterase n=1 Tax=Comamonas sp. Y33R10-2 TaxID=2853257 RepID=UPI001C5CB5C4|nr:EAL domain-containing protein [Comamonas sp. Y33R10-2]QXZ10817.1 EAL domain-containing protein [Comamonas sp. Y33R10-2]
MFQLATPPTFKAASRWLALIALIFGVGTGALGAWALHQRYELRTEKRLEHSAAVATRELEQRLLNYEHLLTSLAHDLGNSEQLNQQLFAQYAHAQLSQRAVVGLQALSLTKGVPEDKHADLEEGAQAFEISYVWPLVGNESLVGTNARQPAAAFHSLISAWNSRQMSMSGPFRFLQLPSSPDGVILRMPLRMPLRSDVGGFAASQFLMGTLNASIRLADLSQDLLPRNLNTRVTMRLLDLSPAALPKKPWVMGSKNLTAPADAFTPAAQTLFTADLWDAVEGQLSFETVKQLDRQIQVNDRVWAFQFKPVLSSQYRMEKTLPWLALAAGVLAGLVLAAWVLGWWQSRWRKRIKVSAQARQASDARFHSMYEHAAMGMIEINAPTRSVLKVNQHFCSMLGYEVHELLSSNVMDLLMLEDREHYAHMLDELDLGQVQHNAAEFRLRAKDGSPVWVQLNAYLIGSQEAKRLQVLVQDVSGRKRLEQMERMGHQQLRTLMQRLPVGLVMEDLQGRLVYWNEEFVRLAGHGGQLDGSSLQWWERMFPDAAERERLQQRWESAKSAARKNLKSQQAQGAALDEDGVEWDEFSPKSSTSMIAAQPLLLTGSDGQRRPVAVSAVLQSDGCLMVMQDQSLRIAAEQKVNRLAFYDALTDLPNRRLLADRLQHALAAAQRKAHFGAVLLLDIDNFKAFNEAYGLEQGDLLLQTLGQRILSLLPPGATLARQGGDEFSLLIEDLGSDAVAAAARLEQEASQWLTQLREPMIAAGVKHSVTVSIGLSLFGDQALSAEEVQRRAEMAMYQAKSMGRNVSCFFDPLLQAALQERRSMEQDMRDGVAAGEFELYYQPQVEMGKVIGAEALLRWKHPKKGFVPPADFIPLAEESGVILPLGDWVLHAACKQLATWAEHPRYSQLVLAVNVSPKQFHQSDFVEQVLKALAEHGANAKLLKLELTEGMLLADMDDTIAKMHRLKSYGISFALDDFGTGYSSLYYLKRLPLDQLKIDRSFVRDVLTDPNDGAIARTIVGLANSLGLHVIAEGVETKAQCRFLESIRCYAWQGFLMSPPVAVSEFERLVTVGNVPGVPAPTLSPASMR